VELHVIEYPRYRPFGICCCVWMSSFQFLEKCCFFIFRIKQSTETLKIEALWSIKTWRACDPTAQVHIPEGLNSYQHHYENLKYCNFFRFATQSDSGLLLYNGRYNEKHDFIALEIVDGAIRFSFSLGSNITTTVATLPHRVSDGNWHSVTVQYFNKVKVTFQPFLQIITPVDYISF